MGDGKVLLMLKSQQSRKIYR